MAEFNFVLLMSWVAVRANSLAPLLTRLFFSFNLFAQLPPLSSLAKAGHVEYSFFLWLYQ